MTSKHLIVLILRKSKRWNQQQSRKIVYLMKRAGYPVHWTDEKYICFDPELQAVVGFDEPNSSQIQWTRTWQSFMNDVQNPVQLTKGTVLTTEELSQLKLQHNPEPLE